jgi:uncharacterized protein (TIGR03067 family)
MSKGCLLILGVAWFATLVPAPAHQKPTPGGDPQKNLQGEWVLQTIEFEGKDLPDATRRNLFPEGKDVLVVKGNRLSMLDVVRMTFQLDPTTTPCGIDLKVEPQALGESRLGVLLDIGTLEGIYELNGDTFKICVSFHSHRVKERPTTFKTAPSSRNAVLVFQRKRSK